MSEHKERNKQTCLSPYKPSVVPDFGDLRPSVAAPSDGLRVVVDQSAVDSTTLRQRVETADSYKRTVRQSYYVALDYIHHFNNDSMQQTVLDIRFLFRYITKTGKHVCST